MIGFEVELCLNKMTSKKGKICLFKGKFLFHHMISYRARLLQNISLHLFRSFHKPEISHETELV